jgi:transmembrane protein TMEM260 (protein O-mannosyltransferase)
MTSTLPGGAEPMGRDPDPVASGADPVGPRYANRVAVACLVATLSFWAYTQTLLPGVDLGDTGGFQAAVLSPDVSARQAYPLYYRLARPFVHAVSSANPARGLNLFSAIFGAASVGLLVFLCAAITRSLAAGIAAGLLLAFSYTFWSQAIIAEVYTLHLTLVLACCLTLYVYALGPSWVRLAVFFAVYAVSFGNHLSMILLLVPFTIFLLQVTPEARSLFRPPTIALAAALAAAGALQYWPNFTSTWHVPHGPATWPDRIATFWFDTTKADWRESMLLGVRGDQLAGRAGMWWFDARQQFGVAGLILAVVGAMRLWMISRPWATLVTAAYAINTAFAFTYNVGDTHVFYLPSHLFTAVMAGAALSWFGGPEKVRPAHSAARTPSSAARTLRGPQVTAIAIVAVLIYAGWRGWDTWPAIDRHDDRRAEALVTRLTLGVNQQNSVLVTNLNWQLENALLYFTRSQRRDIAWVRLPDVMLHFPFLVRDNEAISRDIVMDSYAAHDVTGAYGPLFPLQPDPLLPVPDLGEAVALLPAGTPYVLCLLTPPREEHLDPVRFATALATLTRQDAPAVTNGAYQLIAGLSGEAPLVTRSADRPFRAEFRLLDEPFTVRMESWLPSDTFRRAGFGHVLRGREHVLTLERGVNLVWFDRSARPSPPLYAASLYAPGPRYRISSVSPSFARVSP